MLIKIPTRLLLPLAISLAGLSVSSAQANEFEGESIELDEQVVSGRLYANPVSAAAFNVTVLEQADLQKLPVNNVIDALEYVSGIDVRKRGISGVQADVGIRGSTYEQTLVLLDGMRMNDPQTGHHNFDLPIAFEDIERIEIVKGPGAAQYGPSSNGGVINIVSRKEITTDSGRSAKVNIQRGSYDFERYALSLAKTEGEYSQFLSGYHSAADTYIGDEALDSRQGQGSYRVVHQGEKTTTQVAFGYIEKDFGAYRFYVPAEAQSRESTSQRHGYGIHQYRFANGSQLEASLNWRNHFDFYKYTPASTPSEHETEALQSRLTLSNGAFISGLEFNQENMDSNRDGRQARHFASAFLNYKQLIGANVSLTGNLSYVDYDSQERFVLPVIGIDALLSENIEVYANAGQSVRTPTLNDLYLNMPGRDVGSEDLDLEKTNSAEIGARMNSSAINIATSIFYKDTQNAIDFTKTQVEFDANLAHVARNYGDNITKGFDVEFDASAFSAMSLGMNTLKLTHTRLIQTIKTDLVVLKNTDGQLENQTALHAGFDFYNNYSLLTTYKYESRFNSENYEILDLRLAYEDNNLTLALAGSNLLDAQYIDAGFVEVAGPALIFELGYKL
ncbi:MAG: iron complex outermembrane receptor protein [Oleispira sp.]|jgi:iron complex outermembrane receptor protein